MFVNIMVKKIICLCVAFCMAFTLMIPGYAQEKGSSISSDTIITEDNIYEVLEYLGIDSSNYVKTDVSEIGISTVGDLQKAIKQAEKMPKEISGQAKKKSSNTVDEVKTNSLDVRNFAAASSGTVMLYTTVDADGYVLEYAVAGQYSNGLWTGGGSASVDIDALDVIFVRKIGNKSFNISAIEGGTKLKVVATISVDLYLGLEWGMIKVGTQTVNSTLYWYQSDIPD